jgi:hypothetical protein
MGNNVMLEMQSKIDSLQLEIKELENKIREKRIFINRFTKDNSHTSDNDSKLESVAKKDLKDSQDKLSNLQNQLKELQIAKQKTPLSTPNDNTAELKMCVDLQNIFENMIASEKIFPKFYKVERSYGNFPDKIKVFCKDEENYYLTNNQKPPVNTSNSFWNNNFFSKNGSIGDIRKWFFAPSSSDDSQCLNDIILRYDRKNKKIWADFGNDINDGKEMLIEEIKDKKTPVFNAYIKGVYAVSGAIAKIWPELKTAGNLQQQLGKDYPDLSKVQNTPLGLNEYS